MSSYHMRRQEKAIEDPRVFDDILKRGQFAILALCRENEPYAVTMNYGFDASRNTLYFHCAKEGLKIDFIRQNARVCGTVVEDRGYKTGECDHAYRSLVFWGRIAIVDNTEEKKHALDVMIHHLEEDPDPVRRRTLSKEDVTEKVCILRLDIDTISGKQG